MAVTDRRTSAARRPPATSDEPGGGDAGGGRLDRRAIGFWAGVGLLAVWVLLSYTGLPADALKGDLGIQFHLSRETARGAVPILDFEHGWNALGWYGGALLYLVAGGNPTVWTFLWRQVIGTFLAGTAVLVAARRLGWSAGWIVGLASFWLLLTWIPNGKYSLPSLWLLAFLPVWSWMRGRSALAVRAAAGALTVLAHIDLAIMLIAGLALYDLFGARDVELRTRLGRAAAAGAGAVAAFAVETAVYATLGLTPGALVGFLILERGATVEGVNFGYPLLLPGGARQLLYPLAVVLPFVPAIWRRSSETTRLAAFLQVGCALIAIRKADDPHVAAASTLLAFVLVSGARDLLAARTAPAWASVRGPLRRAGAAALGLLWAAAALAVAFEVPSLAAWLGLMAVLLVGALAARRGDLPWASAGAVAGLAAVAVLALGNTVATGQRDDRGELRAELIAAWMPRDLAKCAPEGRAWIVDQPLSLYETAGLDNPTPFYLFWSGFAREADRLEPLFRDAAIPTIVQVNEWPASFSGAIGDAIEQHYEVCSVRHVETTKDRVTLWRHRSLPADTGV